MTICSRAFGALLALAATTTAIHADTYRLATNVTEDSTAGQLLASFASAVAERTEGRVAFQMFHNGVLGEQAQYDLSQTQGAYVHAVTPGGPVPTPRVGHRYGGANRLFCLDRDGLVTARV